MNNTLNNTDMNTKPHKSSLLYPELSYIIQGCFFETRKQYGPGQKENIYQRVLEEKFLKANLKTEREKRINIYSQDTGKIVGAYQPDLVIEDKVIIENERSPQQAAGYQRSNLS